MSPDLALDTVELGDAREGLGGDGCGSAGGEFVEAAANVRPTEGERHGAFVGQLAIADIAVDLQDAAEASEMVDRPLGLAIGRVDVDDRWRIGAPPRSIVTGVSLRQPSNEAAHHWTLGWLRPELPRLGPPSAGVENRRGGLIGEEPR